jgi:hypothetical protein
MVFRSGKYQGYTIEEVTRIAPWYIRWVKENRPEMLRERTPKKKVVQVTEDEEVTSNRYKNIRPATPEEAF